MRLAFLIRDTEYRDALMETISEIDRNIYLEIGVDSITSAVKNKTMLITDLNPDDIEEETLQRIKDRTIFISSKQNNESMGDLMPQTVFKYDSLSQILSEITDIYHKWTGEIFVDKGRSRLFAICGESDNLTGMQSRSLARQIIFRHGGSVLILPLAFINDYGVPSLEDAGQFTRLMYYINDDRNYNIESFIRRDSYGISYLIMPCGINPIAYLDSKDMLELLWNLGRQFETVIIDIGSCYTKTNMMMLRSSDNVMIVRSQQRSFDPASLIGTEVVEGDDYIRVDISKDKESELKIDAYLMKLYGIDSGRDDISQKNSNQI
ncbi:MAG: hypothetical protein GX083_04410 [Clostridiales bacterium]|nr:hypothetical protein [Clostridiales bacterium]